MAWDGEPIDFGIAPDNAEALAEVIKAAAGVDVLLMSGGASVGEHDLIRTGLATCGLTPSFWKIAMRPGKPLMFGLLGNMPVLVALGNPVAALVCALVFLRPAMSAMLQLATTSPVFERAVLGCKHVGK
jgi:molybdopterin molybdotransferase